MDVNVVVTTCKEELKAVADGWSDGLLLLLLPFEAELLFPPED